MKILIIEDEEELAKSINDYLSNNTFYCNLALTAETALSYLNIHSYDCIVLDISLPDGNGIDLLRTLKLNKNPTGVLIISAKNSLDDKLIGLEIGADDYLTKPFHLPELAARINAIIRRRIFSGKDEIIFDCLKVNVPDMNVSSPLGSISLTKKEFELLVYFFSNLNKVITKEAILEHLWDEDSHRTENFELIYSHIKNLRKKLMEKGCPDYINSVYGIGYKFGMPGKEVLAK